MVLPALCSSDWNETGDVSPIVLAVVGTWVPFSRSKLEEFDTGHVVSMWLAHAGCCYMRDSIPVIPPSFEVISFEAISIQCVLCDHTSSRRQHNSPRLWRAPVTLCITLYFNTFCN